MKRRNAETPKARHRQFGSLAVLLWALACGAWLLPAETAVGQFGQGRPVLLENGRIVTMDGRVIENGSVLIRQGRIVEVGGDISSPPNAQRIDLAGGTVTPGLIDAMSTLGLTAPSGSGGATHETIDAVNPYAQDDFRDALANGLTTVALPARSGTGVQGQGVVIRLTAARGVIAAEAVDDTRMLCIDLASSSGATARLNLLDGLRRQFRSAVEYREAVELYEEEQLPDYLEKIAERAAENNKEEGDEPEEGSGEVDAGEAGGERPSGRRGRGGGGRAGAADDVVDHATDRSGGGDADAAEPGMQNPPRPARRGRGGAAQGRGAARGGRRGGNGEDEIRKPQKPSRNPTAEVLLRAVDQELPVAITAHRSADIISAMELADEFGLSIIILGGSEAHTVASHLAAKDVPVVLTPDLSSDELAEQIGSLEHAGVRWTIGTAAPSLATRGLLISAQAVARAGGVDPLDLLTRRAADVLRLGDASGRITRGGDADLVVWSGDPLDPASRVQRVYVNGRIVYEAAAEDAAGPQGGAQ